MISGNYLARDLAWRVKGDRLPEIAQEYARIADPIAEADEGAARQSVAGHLPAASGA
ncbi:hypothetical protein [Roseomonas populi]|uniref:Uncharacterized protein n=1 Tax=Roseomonas populi TaxID=3121582 RepID=A0ABT1X5W9_9PROT|nr:hypothetical protein [Roseomonas pecuniae]MCR0982384.1 hypothetical protein [Roseomonas pecuniae]